MSKKRKKRVKLLKDRNGTPIHVGDQFDSLGYRWVANEDGTSDEDSSDNLGAGKIIWKKEL